MRLLYLLLLIIYLPAGGQSHPTGNKYQFAADKMGTQFRILFYDKTEHHAQEVAAKVFDRVDELNLIFSDYLPHSEISRISKSAGTDQRIAVSLEMWEVLTASQNMSQKSQGAFDLSVGPLSKLWRRARRQQQYPSDVEIAKAKSKVNYRWIKLYRHKREVKLQKPGMRLDMGGIAKGYTIDQISLILQGEDIHSFLIDGGGDILVGQAPPDGTGWRIVDQNHRDIELKEHQALAVSGSTFQFLEWRQQKYSHIINTKSGRGATTEQLFYVEASSCMLADALATTISLLPAKKSKRLLKQFEAQRHSAPNNSAVKEHISKK